MPVSRSVLPVSPPVSPLVLSVMQVSGVLPSSPGSSSEWFVTQPRPYYQITRAKADSTQILILIFAEVLGLYGLIVALILNTNSSTTYQVSSISSSLPQRGDRIPADHALVHAPGSVNRSSTSLDPPRCHSKTPTLLADLIDILLAAPVTCGR